MNLLGGQEELRPPCSEPGLWSNRPRFELVAVRWMFTLNWWRRVWVVHELFLAKSAYIL
jgi:hypothetical protein